jgi:hypothetical protein
MIRAGWSGATEARSIFQAEERTVRLLRMGWLLMTGGLLATQVASVSAQTLFIRPGTSQGPGQQSRPNPFLFNRDGNTSVIYSQGFGPQQQAVGAVQAYQQQGVLPPAGVVPGSGLPPFSTQPPPRYFFNYQPYYPLLPGVGGVGPVPSIFAGPPVY